MKKEKAALILATLSIISLLFLLFFSHTTSPLYNYLTSDSANYVAMGKFWKDGNIPYLDFFDHKGPLIFFVEMLGNLLIDGKYGVFIIQWISLVMTLYGIYKIVRFFLSKKKAFITTLLSLLILNTFYNGGNCNEEYCNIFITWSLYLIIRYLVQREENASAKHSPWNSFFYGISFMACVLIRVTNALPLCCFILIGLLVLAKDKRYKEILMNSLFFIGGSVVLATPFIIYFILHNALGEMIYATFIHNFIYVSSVKAGGMAMAAYAKLAAFSLPLLAALGIGIFGLKCRRGTHDVYAGIIFSTVCGLVLWYTGRPYPHYLIIWLPVLALVMAILWKEFKIKAGIKYFLLYASALFFMFIPAKNLLVIQKSIQIYYNEDLKKELQSAKNLSKFIKSNSVLAYNLEASVYIETDLNPSCRFFAMQDWICGFNEKLENEFKDCISKQKAEYIFIGASSENKEEDLIYQNYNVVAKDENLILLEKDAAITGLSSFLNSSEGK